MRTLVTIFFGLALNCHAGPIFTVIFTPDTVSGNAGTVVSFFGSLTNNDSVNNEYINNDSGTLPGFTVDASPFLNNAPIFLAPGASSGTFLFFNVTIPNGKAPGNYSSAFNVSGGVDGGAGTAQDPLGTGNFTVNVAGVPEPASLLLVGAGLLAVWRRRTAW